MFLKNPSFSRLLMLVSCLVMISTTSVAQADWSEETKAWLKQAFGFNLHDNQVCDEYPAPLEGFTAPQLMRRGQVQFSKKRYCDAAQAYSEILRQYPTEGEIYRQAWIELIRSYRMAKESVLALNEAMRMAVEMRASPSGEIAHRMVIEMVYEKLQPEYIRPERPFTEFAMGVNPQQNKGNPYFQTMIVQSFLDLYPNSSAAEQMRKIQDQARNQLCEMYLNQAKVLEYQRNYVLAQRKYMIILRWGPVVEVFPKALYQVTTMNFRLSEELLDPNIIIDARLQEFLKSGPLDDTEIKITPELRANLSAQTLDQAKKLLALMKDKLPEHELTQKAINQYGEK